METFRDVINSNGLVLVDFYATWCGPCKMMHPVLEQLQQQLGDKSRSRKMYADRQQAVAQLDQVQSVPTLMLFRSGNQLWRQSGAMPLNQLYQIVQQYL